MNGDGAAAIDARSELLQWIAEPQSAVDRFSSIPPTPVDALPNSPAVYLISSSTSHYVGLALDVRHRFWNPDYGHLTPANRCRSRHVLEQGDVVVRLLEQPTGNDDHVRKALSVGEIRAFAELTTAGHVVVNSVATLGRVGESTGAPVVLCDYVAQVYIYCDSLIAAQRFLDSTALPAVVHGYQRTALGHTARWALPHEVDALAESVPSNGVFKGQSVDDAVNSAPSRVEWRGAGRNAGFAWTSGPLTSADCEHLASYQRGRYQQEIPKSAFNGVSWESSRGRWQCRAKTGPGSKDLWQTSRLAWTSDVDAAVYREERIRAEGWESFNTGRYASNAVALNAALGEQRYESW